MTELKTVLGALHMSLFHLGFTIIYLIYMAYLTAALVPKIVIRKTST